MIMKSLSICNILNLKPKSTPAEVSSGGRFLSNL